MSATTKSNKSKVVIAGGIISLAANVACQGWKMESETGTCPEWKKHICLYDIEEPAHQNNPHYSSEGDSGIVTTETTSTATAFTGSSTTTTL